MRSILCSEGWCVSDTLVGITARCPRRTQDRSSQCSGVVLAHCTGAATAFARIARALPTWLKSKSSAWCDRYRRRSFSDSMLSLGDRMTGEAMER